ncbi:MAG TPA: T9SS type A sorting domain-containing protein [Saprospiraceae bacterium]|nr:T9SS type A sorting domain-containing protein [Saprospiraceae bacterium]
MHKGIAILLFILLTNFSHAQSANFLADGSRWVYHTQETSEPGQEFVHSSDEQYIIHGDTIIDGLTYFKLYSTFHNRRVAHLSYPMPPLTFHYYDSVGPAFLRYDTLLNRVYHLPGIDSTERLIYDFNLQIGDTTPLQSPNFEITVIASIDTITVFGVPAKRFVLDIGDSGVDWFNYIIEGIGGSNGLLKFQPEFGSLSGGAYITHLNCFQTGDSIFSPENLDCPFIDFISGTKQPQNDYTLTVSPNPTQGLFTLNISEELLNATFTITDCVGRVIQSFKLTDLNFTAQLNSPGIYFWSVVKDGRLVETGKVICE